MSPRRQGLRERVASALLEAASATLARGGDQANMADVADAAGVARATLYRYFPSREALLEALITYSIETAGEQLEVARLDAVPVEEGFARAVRTLVVVGDYFVVLMRERARSSPAGFEQRIAMPVRALIERGQSEGELRADIQAPWLLESLLGLIVSVLLASPRLGIEDMVAAITGLFLDGARARHPAT
jgi:TetR/AcrR family transcriptional repressor of mexCD-oprJ operon